MSCVLNRQRASGSGAQGGGGFIVENSLRFNELDSAQLNYTNSSAPTDASKAIIGAWIYPQSCMVRRGKALVLK